MTTDTLQDKQLKWKARITDTKSISNKYNQKKDGIELTRMQNFLDGGYDIFDVLEDHAANTQMKIKVKNTNTLDLDLTYDKEAIRNSSLFKSLLARLRAQMKDMV